jgi:hypothetical protein
LKLIHLLILLTLSCALFSQEKPVLIKQKTNITAYQNQSRLVDDAINKCYIDSSIIPLDELIQSNSLTINDLQHEALINRLIVLGNLYQIYQAESITDTAMFLRNYKYLIHEYNKIIKQTTCEYRSMYKLHRFLILDMIDYKFENLLLNDNLKTLLEIEKKNIDYNYFLPPRDIGITTELNYIRSNENWIGLDIGLGFYEPKTSYYDRCDNSIKKHSRGNATVSSNLFKLGYRRNLNTNTNEFTFSLFDYSQLIFFEPLKLGVQYNKSFGHFRYFYRPSVGMAMGPLKIALAYNLMLNKVDRPNSESFMWIFKFSYPIWGDKYL